MKFVSSAFTVWMMVTSSSYFIQAAGADRHQDDHQPLEGGIRGASNRGDHVSDSTTKDQQQQRYLAPPPHARGGGGGRGNGQEGRRKCGIKVNDSLPTHANGRAHANFQDLSNSDCDDSGDITFELADGTVKTFHHGQSGSGIGNNPHYWVGQDDSGSTFNLIREDNGIVAGSYTDADTGDIYQMGIDADGNSMVEVTPTGAFPPEADPEDVPVRDRALVAVQEAADNFLNDVSNHVPAEISTRKRNLDETTIIDIMVIWTKRSECRKASLSATCTPTSTTWDGMKAHIDVAILESNNAFASSGVHAQLNLVHADRENTGYTEVSFSEALNDVTSRSRLSHIRTLRNTYKADAVALIIDNPSYCGIGWVGPSNNYMYSVTSWKCATGYYSFVHEVGHNMGLRHDRGTSSACGGGGYNYGYREPNSRFRTVMSYDCTGGCDLVQTKSLPSRPCTRLPAFSNVEYTYNGYAMGNSGANAARHLNDVKAIVASYRTGSTPPPVSPPTPPPVAPPTPPPVAPPTPPPVSPPTPPPVAPPTPPPVSPPTPPPVAPPTPPPVSPPTPPPVSPPTPPPVAPPTPPPVAPPTPPPTSGGIPGVDPWNPTTIYWGGDYAIYDGELIRAKWWTRGDTPNSSIQWGHPWEFTGTLVVRNRERHLLRGSDVVDVTPDES